MITQGRIMFFSSFFILSLPLAEIIFEIISSLVDSGTFWWERSVRYNIQDNLTLHLIASSLRSIIWEVCLHMIVTSNRSLFNNLAKILCRYDSNEREKPSSTNLAELFIYAVPFQFLTACLVFSTGERGAVVLHGFFRTMQMDFGAVVYTQIPCCKEDWES